ncbi:MAG: hypothetical protein ACP5LQ_09210 [Candidatus Methanodesulfokora sp.]
MKVLENARKRRTRFFISPASLVELSLILKSKGLGDGEIQVFDAIDSTIKPMARLIIFFLA